MFLAGWLPPPVSHLSLSALSLHLRTIMVLVESSILLRLKGTQWQQHASHSFKTKGVFLCLYLLKYTYRHFFLRLLYFGNFHPIYCSQINFTIITHCILTDKRDLVTLLCLLFPIARGWPWCLHCLNESCYIR